MIFYTWIKGESDKFDFFSNSHKEAAKKHFHRYGIRKNDIICVSGYEDNAVKEFSYEDLI